MGNLSKMPTNWNGTKPTKFSRFKATSRAESNSDLKTVEDTLGYPKAKGTRFQ